MDGSRKFLPTKSGVGRGKSVWRPKVQPSKTTVPPPRAATSRVVTPPRAASPVSPPSKILGDTNPQIIQLMFMQFDYEQIIGVMEGNDRVTAALDDWFWTNKVLTELKVHPKDVNKVLRMLQRHIPQTAKQFDKMTQAKRSDNRWKEAQKRVRKGLMTKADLQLWQWQRHKLTEERIELLVNYDDNMLAHRAEDLFIDSVDKCRIYYVRAIVRIYPIILLHEATVERLIKTLINTVFNQDCIENIFRELAKIKPENFISALGNVVQRGLGKVKISSRVLNFLIDLAGSKFNRGWLTSINYNVQAQSFDYIFNALLQYHPEQAEEWAYEFLRDTIRFHSPGQITALLVNDKFMSQLPINKEIYLFIMTHIPVKYAPNISKIRHLTSNSKGMYMPMDAGEVTKWIKFGFDRATPIVPKKQIVLIKDQNMYRVLRRALSGEGNEDFLDAIKRKHIYISWKERNGTTRYYFPSEDNLAKLEEAIAETEDPKFEGRLPVAEYTRELLAADPRTIKLFQIVYSIGYKTYVTKKLAWDEIKKMSHKQRDRVQIIHVNSEGEDSTSDRDASSSRPVARLQRSFEESDDEEVTTPVKVVGRSATRPVSRPVTPPRISPRRSVESSEEEDTTLNSPTPSSESEDEASEEVVTPVRLPPGRRRVVRPVRYTPD